MEKRSRTKWEKLRDFLVDQSWNYFLARSGELPEEVKLIAGIIVSGSYDEAYLHSELFWMHCMLIGLDHDRVRNCIEICKKGYNVEKDNLCCD